MDDAAQWDDEPAELEPLPYVPTVMDAELFPDDIAAWAGLGRAWFGGGEVVGGAGSAADDPPGPG